MKTFFSLLLILCSLDLYSQNNEIPVKTEVTEATVFINGAQVTRTKVVELQAGNSIIKFTALSPYLDPKSIQVKANGDVTVLSVNHQLNYIDSAARSREMEELTKKVKDLDAKMNVENVNIEIIDEELTFLKDNRMIGGKNQELSLNNLKETSNFYRERITALKMKKIEINKVLENLAEEKSRIEKQINQISSDTKGPMSEVLVKIKTKVPSKCDMELSYFVKNAGWYPSYDIRAKSITEPIELTYKANIHQNTKEDWKNIRIKLSSSNPNLGSVAPQLQPYFLNYNSLPPMYGNFNNQVSGKIFDANTKEPLIGASINIKGTTIGTVTGADGSYSLSIPDKSSQLVFSYIGYVSQTLSPYSSVINVNLTPDQKALDEVVVLGYGTQKKSSVEGILQGRASGISIRGINSVPVAQIENPTSFEFDIKIPYTILSDNKNISVDIDNYSLDADYEYYCVPKVDKDAFLTANITDWEKYNLLEGEANIFFENTFVGKTILDVRHISDTLSLSLGRDNNVVVMREKVKDLTTKQFLGNKKEETRDWKISVKNNKKQPIRMILLDQVPVSFNEEIEVSVENLSGGNLEKDKGEIKWDFNLEPAAKKDLELNYKVKYPKNRMLVIE